MSQRQSDGCTLREHLQSLERQTRETPPELLGPECPEAAAHLWGWFHELNRVRSGSGFGANPIGYVDIAAWARYSGTRPSALEVDWLLELDTTCRSAGEQHKARKP